MKIIILAAGRGERLMPLTRSTPKPLLDMGNGRTLLEEQLRSVRRSQVADEVVLVTGYLASQIEERIAEYSAQGPQPLRSVFNPFFARSNNLMSMWMARSEMLDSAHDAFMVTNGDNLFSPDVFRGLYDQCGPGIWLALGPKKDFDFDDMRVQLDGNDVVSVSKKLSDTRSDAESPGLSLVKGRAAIEHFVRELDTLCRDPQNIDHFWLEVFNALHQSGSPAQGWTFDASSKWQEVDFHADLEALRLTLRLKPGLLDPDG